jgi:phage terminase large subunit-like protein
LSLHPQGADLLTDAINQEEWQHIAYHWAAHARDDQLAPVFAKGGGRWHSWLVLGGRGSGKTRTGAEWGSNGNFPSPTAARAASR